MRESLLVHHLWDMRIAAIAFLLAGTSAFAQVDLPVFGKQEVINGYAKDVEGEVLSYFSVYPEHATTALLTRCTDGQKAIAWETAPVPAHMKDIPSAYYFSWIAAHNSTTSGGDRSFDLYINDAKALTFTTHHSTTPGSWEADGTDGTKLVFEFNKKDRHGDAHGFAHLRVPRKYITPGKPLRLKVVGHAQNSPDWFMTFRYPFEEKVEVEALPFILRGEEPTVPVQFTVMHFGPPTMLRFNIASSQTWHEYPVIHGLQVFQTNIAMPASEQEEMINGTLGEGIPFSAEFKVKPIIHRDIHLVHHSHTDIGYSHLQAEVETIQNNNIRSALELIDRTKDYPEGSRFVWNVESLWAVENFLGIASEADKQRFIAAVKGGSIALSANYANVLTGLCTPEEMHWIVEYADSLRAWYDLPITMAMQTDIPGMSWSMVDAYAAHGIRHLSQGPNYIPDMPDGGDRIGSTLREQGDKPYWWKSTTGTDSILVWTAGQGYGGWHGYTAGAIKERGTRKIAAYMNELDAKRYPYDMVQWRYNIVSDNGPVDSTLSDFVRDWNEKYASPRLIIANAGTMMKEFEEKYGKRIPTWSGDFTPYWEDGAYSTAKEEGDVRVLSARLTNLIEAAKILGKPIDPHLLYRAKRSIVMWHEHTWGAWCSISDPDAHFTTDQWRVKKAFADSAVFYDNRIEYALLEMLDYTDKLTLINTHPWQQLQSVELGDPVNFDTFKSSFTTSAIDEYGTSQTVQRSPNGGLSFMIAYVPAQATKSFSLSGTQNWRVAKRRTARPGRTVMTPSWLPAYKLVYNLGLPTTSSEVHVTLKDTVMSGPIVLNLVGQDSASYSNWIEQRAWFYQEHAQIRFEVNKIPIRDKESLHLALPFNIPNATVRIGIGDTCVTPESGRIPGSNNDFFCAQRWIDVSNDSMGVTIVCPQGALWEVGELVDERKVNPGKGTNPEYYKAWKTEARSSSTIYLYALNNTWHTNFKADQEGPITFDLYLKMHGPFKLEEARRFGLEMTRPLITWWK